MIRKILRFPHPVLRKKAKAVKRVTPEIAKLIDDMIETMHAAPGVGLAAPQVGINKQMILVDIGEGLVTLINPKIIKRKGSVVREEGCLSVPGACIKVKRAKTITVKGVNEKSQEVLIHAEDLFARVLQHEIDHLMGRLISDRLNFVQRMRLKRRIAQLARSSVNGMS